MTTHDVGLNITPKMTIETLGTLDATKAAGPDEINNRVLKEARFLLGEVVADLFNTSLRESFVPAQWKQSNIIPIPKVTNPTKPSECRPVCLTSCLGKAMEKIIAKDILRHTKAIWEKSDQFGFLPGRNTMDAIVKVIDDWERALDNKETIHAVFFDFSKAFDLVNHKRLMQKLKKILPQYLTSWIV